MTTSEATALNEWATHPVGKTIRAAIAVVGLATSAIVFLLATLSSTAVWLMVLLGVTLAATSIRAALEPTVLRLATLSAVMVAIPVLQQLN